MGIAKLGGFFSRNLQLPSLPTYLCICIVSPAYSLTTFTHALWVGIQHDTPSLPKEWPSKMTDFIIFSSSSWPSYPPPNSFIFLRHSSPSTAVACKHLLFFLILSYAQPTLDKQYTSYHMTSLTTLNLAVSPKLHQKSKENTYSNNQKVR